MEAKTAVLENTFETQGRRGTIFQKESALFVATLVATLVLGYTPDRNGIFDWFAAFVPLAGGFSFCKGNS